MQSYNIDFQLAKDTNASPLGVDMSVFKVNTIKSQSIESALFVRQKIVNVVANALYCHTELVMYSLMNIFS